MTMLKGLFRILSQKDDKPVMRNANDLGMHLGAETITHPLQISRDGRRTASMSVVFDMIQGIITSDTVITIKDEKNVTTEYKSRIHAERNQTSPHLFEIKEAILDNAVLDVRKPGLVDLALNRITWYQRMVGPFGGKDKKHQVPTPHALYKRFKKDIHFYGSRLWKIQRYLSSKTQHKAWFG